MTLEHRQPLGRSADEERVLEAVANAAEEWGGEWEPDEKRLTLAVTAGLRIGWVRGEVSLGGSSTGSVPELVFKVEESHFALQRPAVVFLAVAAVGGLFTMLWPFFAHRNPQLIQLAPLAGLFALGGWFLVVSRLRNSGPEDFLGEVAKRLDGS